MVKDGRNKIDKLILSYFGVDYQTLWETIKKRVTEIKPLVENVLIEIVLGTGKHKVLHILTLIKWLILGPR